jgi:hypothetical protein
MKKLLLLFLTIVGYVSTASAWSTFYLNCDDNEWGANGSLPFTYIDFNSYYYVLSGSHVNNGDFYFRFYAKWDGNNGGNHVMPNADKDPISSEVYSTNVVWNDPDNSRAFKIAQNPSAKAVVIYIYYEDDYFHLYTEVLTTSSTVAYTNNTGWSNVYAYAYDSNGIDVLGNWPGTLIEASSNGLYNIEIPSTETTVIFNNGNNTQTNDLTVEDNKVYNYDGGNATQSVSINEYGMSTYCSQYSLNFSNISNLKAYRIYDNNKATGELWKAEVTTVPANTGVYLEGTANGSFTVPILATASPIDDNMLVGVTSDTDINQTDGSGNTNYILTVDKATGTVDTPKFYKVNSAGNKVLANRAYLQIPTTLATREMLWFGGDEATSVNDVKVKENTVKGEVYDLQGRRVANPMKGLYIVNGKKVLF